MCLLPDPVGGRQIGIATERQRQQRLGVHLKWLTPVVFERGRSSPPHASRKTAIRVTIRSIIMIVNEIADIPKEKRPRGERSVIGVVGWAGRGGA